MPQNKKDLFKGFGRKLGNAMGSTLTPNINSLINTNKEVVKTNFRLPNGIKKLGNKENYHKSSKKTISDTFKEIKKGITEGDKKDDSDDIDSILDSVINASNDNNDSQPVKPVKNNTKGQALPVVDNRRTITNVIMSSNNRKEQNITNNLLLTSIKANLQSQQESTSALLSGINAITSFQQETTLSFYNDVSDKLTSIYDAIQTVSKIYSEDNSYEISSKQELLDAIRNEGFNLETMQKIYKRNKSLSALGMLEGSGGLLKDALKELDPVEEMLAYGMEKFIPKRLQKSIKNLDKNVGSIPVNLQYMLNNWSKGGNKKIKIFGEEIDLFEKIGKTFGMDLKPNKNLSTNKYNKGPIAYNGLANKAITSVIPSLLSKILSAVTDNENYRDELVYDYEKGRFTNKGNVRKEYNERLKDTTKNAFSDNDIKEILGGLINKRDNESDKDADARVKSYVTELDRIIYTMASEGKTLSDYKQVTNNKELEKQLRKYYGNHTNKSSFNQKMFDASTNMSKFFEEFSKSENLAGQVAIDYLGSLYGEESNIRKNQRSFKSEEKEEFLDDLLKSLLGKEIKNKFGGKFSKFKNRSSKTDSLADMIDNINDKFGNVMSDNKNVTKSEYREFTDNLFGGTNPKRVNASRMNAMSPTNNPEILNLLRNNSDGNAFRVKIVGGSIDGIRSTLSTREVKSVDLNSNYKSQLSDIDAEDAEDANDRMSSNSLAEDAINKSEDRINAFKERRDSYLQNDEANDMYQMYNIQNWMNKYNEKKKSFIKSGISVFKDSATGKALGSALNTVKENVLGKFKLGQGTTARSTLGKVLSGMKNTNKSADDVAQSGITPVWIMGSNDGSLAVSGAMELSDSSDLLSTITSSGSLKDKALNFGDNLLSKGSGLLGKGSDLLSKLAGSGKGGKLISNLAGKGSGLLSKGAGLLGNSGGITGLLGKGASLLGGSGGISGLLGTAGSAIGGIGSGIAGLAGSAGGALAGVAGTVGPALAGLAPVLGPVAIAALGGVAIAKIGPKLIKGIQNLGGKAIDGIKGLGSKIKDGFTSAGKTALNFGKKALENSPIGLLAKGAKGIFDFFTGKNKKEKEKKKGTKSKVEGLSSNSQNYSDITTGSGTVFYDPVEVLSMDEINNLKLQNNIPEDSDLNLTNTFDNLLGTTSVNSDLSSAGKIATGKSDPILYGKVKSLLINNARKKSEVSLSAKRISSSGEMSVKDARSMGKF